MKKIGNFLIFITLSCSMKADMLDQCPNTIECFNEIATQYNPRLAQLYNQVAPAERVFMYYIFRASLPGNRIVTDQIHRHGVEITDLFEKIFCSADNLNDVALHSGDVATFLKEVKTYLIYLWTNHGQYFQKEQSNEKRTPGKLGLTTITPENLTRVLEHCGHNDAHDTVQKLHASLFDITTEPTVCVSNSIEQSAGNFYSPDFTQKDFESLPSYDRTCINGYFYVNEQDGKRTPEVQRYAVGGKYSKELEVVCHWLQKAHDHVRKHTDHFDEPLVKSLDHLITYLKTGDEEYFKKHSIEWLKTNNRVDYVFGFIETYQDPKSYRGSFQADVTIRSVDIQKLNIILPSLEALLPFPQEFQRPNLNDGAAIPNASINTMIFGAGELAPLQIIAAYSLPNYSEIRAEHGSKQIIYQLSKGLGQLMNPDLYRLLFNLQHRAQWLAKHDAQEALNGDIWEIHCILHETLGHGSGRLDTHTFKEGDPLTINDVTYNVGDTIQVTSENVNEFFAGSEKALEELRAEIIALYASIFMFDELAKAGLYKDWPAVIGKDALIDQMIFDMVWTGLRRLLAQPEGKNEIIGAHAQANSTIMNYLLDGGGLQLVEELLELDGEQHSVLGFRITDRAKVLKSITDLAIEVQRIKSTADGLDAKKLLDTYGRYVRDPRHVEILQSNQKKVVGDLKASARIFPRFIPVLDGNNAIADVRAEWPANIVEQNLEHAKLAMKKD